MSQPTEEPSIPYTLPIVAFETNAKASGPVTHLRYFSRIIWSTCAGVMDLTICLMVIYYKCND